MVRRIWTSWALGITALAVGVPLAVLLWAGPPAIDPTANALRPRNSPAYAALDDVQKLLNRKREPLWLLIGGHTDSEVANRLASVESVLARAVTNGVLADFTLPTALWPQPANQTANRPIARLLSQRTELIRQAAAAAGFAESSIALTESVLRTWQAASTVSGTFWPTNRMSQWILDQATARTDTNEFALGMLNLATNGAPAASRLDRLASELPPQQVWLSGWELLGNAIFSRVKANLWKVLLPMVALVILSLGLAFHRLVEISLSLSTLLLSGLCLLAVMRLADWSWNLLNLMAVPLILGTGVDYSIFMQSALRRHHGDLCLAYVAVGRALLLCGGTAIAGFGSLDWSSNAGMASLGKVCAVGIGGNMLLAVFLLPAWWHATAPALDSPGNSYPKKLNSKK